MLSLPCSPNQIEITHHSSLCEDHVLDGLGVLRAVEVRLYALILRRHLDRNQSLLWPQSGRNYKLCEVGVPNLLGVFRAVWIF